MACSFLDVIMPLPPSPYWPFSGTTLSFSFFFISPISQHFTNAILSLFHSQSSSTNNSPHFSTDALPIMPTW